MKMLSVLLAGFLFLGSLQNGRADCDVASLTTVSGTHAPQGKICPGDLIFEDNFDELDLKKWQHEQTLAGGGNWEFEWYRNNRENSYVENGNLHIRPTLLADEYGEDFVYSGQLDINGGAPADACTNPQWYGCERSGTNENALNPAVSARLRLVESLSFKYGRVEVRAKLPAGDWLWPAIWLLPRYNQYATWPASGEIDLMESRGNRDLTEGGENIGTHLVSSTLHWGPDYNNNKYYLTHFERTNDAGYNADFHSYQMDWNPDRITFSIDGAELGTVTPPDGGFWQLGDLQSTGRNNPWRRNSKMAPFDQEFYIVINLAVGGVNNYFPDDANNPGGKPWANPSGRASTDFWQGKDQWLPTWNVATDDSHLQVDYVRIWAL